ncbi:MAG: hypothetical protein KF799_09440 [Bdellovibrionales bacterium]|nr:hypothetical protein [Bdellovibrionales bacterium]
MKALLFLSLLICPCLAFCATGGVGDGGGGIGVKCETELRVLDLFESEVIGVQKPDRTYLDLQQNLAYYTPFFIRHFNDAPGVPGEEATIRIVKMFESMLRDFQFIPAGERLKPTDDATIGPLPAGCRKVQIAVQDNQGKIQVDRELWDLLPSRDRAALLFHEWIYQRARSYKVNKSDKTRKLVGDLFSESKPQPQLGDVWRSPSVAWCGFGIAGDAEVFEVFLGEESQNGILGLRFYFRGFRGEYVTLAKTGFAADLTLADILERQISLTKIKISDGSELELERNGTRLTLRAAGNPLLAPSGGFCELAQSRK